MAEINNISSILPPVVPVRESYPQAVGQQSAVGEVKDNVEISEAGRALARAEDVSSYRRARIESVRQEIEAGTYETPERVQGTIDRLLALLR